MTRRASDYDPMTLKPRLPPPGTCWECPGCVCVGVETIVAGTDVFHVKRYRCEDEGRAVEARAVVPEWCPRRDRR